MYTRKSNEKVVNKKLKHKLTITHTKSLFNINGEFGRKNYEALELWVVSRRNPNEKILVSEITPNYKFEFSMSLDYLFRIMKQIEGNIANWFMKIIIPINQLSEKRKKSKEYRLITIEGVEYATYLIRLGRFQYTDINNLDFYTQNDESMINYITTQGNLSTIIKSEPNSPVINTLEKSESNEKGFHFKGVLNVGNSKINQIKLLAKGRNFKQDIYLSESKVTFLKSLSQESFGLHYYKYDIKAPFDLIVSREFKDDETYDLYLEFKAHDRKEVKLIRINVNKNQESYFRDFKTVHKSKVLLVKPYLTFRKNNLSFQTTKTSVFKYFCTKILLKYSAILQNLYKNKEVWLIGERVDKAQDNGYALFKHIREKHPKENVYYVIKSDSKEKDNLIKYGQILYYRSLKHILYTIVARNVVTSHHHELIYPFKEQFFTSKLNTSKYYLGHGVTAMKNVVDNYGKNAANFQADYMIASSEKEKQIYMNDYDYDSSEIKITGLPRFDNLFKDDLLVKRQILIIPTWRNWLLSTDQFLKSDFYYNYLDLMNNTSLHEFVSKRNITIVFCMHVNMMKYSHHFKQDNVKVISQEETDIQELIKESSLMITDYSSVAFDHAFLDKPVIFYQFDLEKFLGEQKVHINFEKELPGEIVSNKKELIELIKEYERNNFKIKEDNQQKASKFIKYKDKNSSERVYQEIKNTNSRKSKNDLFTHKLN